jgi:hypothetical protein
MHKARLLIGIMAAWLIGTALSLGSPAPSQADPGTPVIRGCSAGGFDGALRLWVGPWNSIGHRKVYQIDYRIRKNGNWGGNEADVLYNDRGAQPSIKAFTGSGKQDGNWHVLRTSDFTGSHSWGFKFTFDKTLASDPSCVKNFF